MTVKTTKDSKPLLKQAITEWLRSSTKIPGVGGLAIVLGEPVESFRVRLSKNRWSRRILQRLIDETNLAKSIEELSSRFTFEISERTTRQYTAVRTLINYREKVATLTSDDIEAKPVLLAAQLTPGELDYVTACKMSHRVLLDGFRRLLESKDARLILLLSTSRLIEDSTTDLFLHTVLFDSTLKRHIQDALAKGIRVEIHFLNECPAGSDEESHRKFLTKKWGEFAAMFDSNLPGKLHGYMRLLEQEAWLGVCSWCWIHTMPLPYHTGWILFDNLELRARLQNLQNPWMYSILTAPLPEKKIVQSLKQLHYKLGSKGWTYEPVYDPTSGRREYSLNEDTHHATT